MWFGQGHREPNPVPVSGRAKSPEDPKQMHRGSAPDPERSRRKLPRQEEEGVFGQGHMEQTQCPCQDRAKSPPRKDSEMQKKRTGPGAPRAGRSEGKSGETRRFGEGLGKLGICGRLTIRKVLLRAATRAPQNRTSSQP